MNLKIDVTFPDNRDFTGKLSLRDETGKVIAGPFFAYGRSDGATAAKHGNPSRNSLLKYGNTPTGDYRVPVIVNTGAGTNYGSRSYGPHEALVLEPTGGQALESKINGRTGLMIHGGDPGANGRLRATHGCVRLSNDDMRKLLDAIAKVHDDPVSRQCRVTQIAASIGPEGDPVSGEDVGDPPPLPGDIIFP